MDRVTVTLDGNGHAVCICADAGVEAYLVSPGVPRDRVYRWSLPWAGRAAVDGGIGGRPVGYKDHLPALH